MQPIKRIPSTIPETALQRHVARWLNSEGRERDDGATGAYRDLMHGGCSSGVVGHLIYYRDTVKFYKRHQREIDILLRDTLDDCGGPVADLFKRAGWDDSDPLAREAGNQNILAWFGFEESARFVYERAEQEREKSEAA
jgi:hypothetical protein